jgi:RNA polymerase sigma factor (sigma-70 family)
MTKPINDVYSFIYNMAFNMLECHHYALDIAQYIIVQYNKKLESNPEIDENYKKFWVIRATKNKCLNLIRNNKKFSFSDPQDMIHFEDISQNASQILEETEERHYLHAKLKNYIDTLLTNKQKQILNLRYFQELPYKEICKITGYSEVQAKCLVHRAVKVLKNKMKS